MPGTSKIDRALYEHGVSPFRDIQPRYRSAAA